MEPKEQLHLELGQHAERKPKDRPLEAPWRKLREYCENDLRFGEIVLIIQNGQPVFAEQVTKKIRFS